MTSRLRLACVLEVGGLLIVGGAASPPDAAPPAPSPPTATPDPLAPSLPADTTDTLAADHPNRTPYRSERSLLRHVLAAPSYALHYATRPLGWAVREVEEHFPRVFEGRLPSYGAYPILEAGGDSDFAGGGVLFYNRLPWGGRLRHDAQVRALVGSRIYNRFEAQYAVRDAFDGTTGLRLRARHANDPRVRFFPGGNDAPEANRAFYASGRTDLRLTASTRWTDRIGTEVRAQVERMNVDPDAVELKAGEDLPLPAGLPGVGTTNLASVEAAAIFDLASQTERSTEGTRLRLGAEYAQDLDGAAHGGPQDVRFLRYRAEAVQFVPLPLLPTNRRLALRGLLEKAEPLGGGRVPFYRLPALGGPERLRGYRNNRFQDEGALLLTAEYRWAVWDNLDALLFAETGQVFSHYGEIAPRGFHTGYGGGLHLLTGGQLAFRLELAAGPEGLHTLLTVRPAF